MILLITILIVIACAVLAFFVLIQAPKGGGLAGNFGSMSTQVMGVKQSTDVMEKGTWTAMGVIAGLCIVSVLFLEKPARVAEPTGKEKPNSAQPSSTQPATPPPAAPAK